MHFLKSILSEQQLACAIAALPFVALAALGLFVETMRIFDQIGAEREVARVADNRGE